MLKESFSRVFFTLGETLARTNPIFSNCFDLLLNFPLAIQYTFTTIPTQPCYSAPLTRNVVFLQLLVLHLDELLHKKRARKQKTSGHTSPNFCTSQKVMQRISKTVPSFMFGLVLSSLTGYLRCFSILSVSFTPSQTRICLL